METEAHVGGTYHDFGLTEFFARPIANDSSRRIAECAQSSHLMWHMRHSPDQCWLS